jgi:hypothetical protein
MPMKIRKAPKIYSCEQRQCGEPNAFAVCCLESNTPSCFGRQEEIICESHLREHLAEYHLSGHSMDDLEPELSNGLRVVMSAENEVFVIGS